MRARRASRSMAASSSSSSVSSKETNASSTSALDSAAAAAGAAAAEAARPRAARQRAAGAFHSRFDGSEEGDSAHCSHARAGWRCVEPSVAALRHRGAPAGSDFRWGMASRWGDWPRATGCVRSWMGLGSCSTRGVAPAMASVGVVGCISQVLELGERSRAARL